jgi:hypothetical protein
LWAGNASPMWQSDETIGIRADTAPPDNSSVLLDYRHAPSRQARTS